MPLLTIAEAREYYRGKDSAHDFEHILRVLAWAERIGQEEGADLEILRAAVLLHDLGREEGEKDGDHALAAAQEATRILLANGIPQDKIAGVEGAIRSHRFRGGPKPQSLEAKILYDADKLDALGAIGVARAYALAGKLGQRLWAEMPPGYHLAMENLSSEHTPNFEYLLKLRHLKDTLYTKTARRIAVDRHRFMVNFFHHLEEEMRGEI